METSRKSTLKTWTVQNVKRGKRRLLGIICPNCDRRAIVSRSWLGDESQKLGTRPCTYCFKASWLPGKHPVEEINRIAQS